MNISAVPTHFRVIQGWIGRDGNMHFMKTRPLNFSAMLTVTA
jgi:hypothetical protein